MNVRFAVKMGRWTNCFFVRSSKVSLDQVLADPDFLKVFGEMSAPILEFPDSDSEIEVDVNSCMRNSTRRHDRKNFIALP